MRNILYALVLLLTTSLSTYAQITFSATPDNIAVNAGEEVKIEIKVSGYIDVLSAGFHVNWDPSVLGYVEKGDINDQLPGLAGSIGDVPSNTDNGEVRFSFFDFTNFQAYTLADGTTLFSLTFTALTNGTTTIDFSNFEILDSSEQSLTVTTESSTVTVGDGNGGTTNTDPVEISIGTGTGEVGQQVCVPLVFSNFEDMNSIQFSIDYNESILQFAEIRNVNSTVLSPDNFGTPPSIAAGNLTLAWADMSGSSQTIPNNTTVAEICFDLLTAGQSNLIITGSPLAIEAMRSEAGSVGIDGTPGRITATQPSGGGGSDNLTLSILPGDVNVAVGENFTVDLIVDNYVDVLSAGFKITWNPSVLTYVDKSNISDQLPGLAGSIGDVPSNTDNGEIRFSYFDFTNFQAYTLPNGTRLFSITFTGLANGTTQIGFTDFELLDSQETAITNDVNVSTVVVGDGSGGGNSDPVLIEVGSTSGQNGQRVCVPVTANNFSDMESLQLSINYDANVLNFNSIDNTNLEGLSAASFGTPTNPNISEGNITMTWSNTAGASTTVANGTRLFDLCFDLVGSSGSSSAIQITDSPIVKEGIRAEVGEVTVNNNNGNINITGGGMSDQFELLASSTNVQPGGAVCIDVSVKGFQDIVSSQFSMAWNTNVLAFDKIELPANNILNLQTGASGSFRTTETNAGQLSVTWDDGTVQGIDVPDNTIIFSVCFIAVGTNGQSSDFSFSNTPLTIEVINANFQEETVTTTNGRVTIAGDPVETDCDANAFPVCISKETVGVGDEVCVSVTAQNFTDIVGLQFSILFDPSSNIASFNNVNIGNSALGLVEDVSVIVNRANGTIAMRWDDATLDGITIPNGIELFSICFTANAEGQLPITFQEFPTPIEVIDVNFNVVSFRGSDGSLTVEQSCTAPTVSETVTDVDCAGAETGAIELTVTGGDGNYNYSWNGPTNIPNGTQNPTGLRAGTYGVTVENCGDPIERFITVGQPQDGLNVSANVTQEVLCFGGSDGAIEIMATGGAGTLVYQWDDTAANVANRDNLSAQTYSVTISDENDCDVTIDNIVVTGPSEALTFSTEKQDVTCSGSTDGAVQVAVEGGTPDYTIAWRDDANATQFTRTGLASGAYDFEITDSNGCPLTGSITVEQSGDAVIVSDTVITKIENSNGAIDITVEGGEGTKTYAWEGPGPFSAATEDISGLTEPGEYIVTISDENGCVTIETYLVPLPMQVAEFEVTNTCSNQTNGAINIDIQGGFPPYSYLWSDASSTSDADSLAAGEYDLTVTDSRGETFVTQLFNVGSAPNIEVDAMNISPETCNDLNDDGAVEISVSGGTGTLSWVWENGSFDNVANRTNLTHGDYEIVVTDELGCTQTEIINIPYEPSSPEITNLSIQPVTCNGLADGSIAFNVSCGDPNYTVTLMSDTMYRFTFNEYNPRVELTDLPTGTYQITITESNELSTADEITIDAPESLNIVPTVFSTTEVFPPCNGQIRLNVTGGERDYTYDWSHSGNEDSGVVTSLCPGDYTVTVTDARGCLQIDTVNLSVLNANGIVTDAICPSGDNSGAIALEVQTGQAPFTFEWFNEDGELVNLNGEQNLSGVSAGFYTVRITEQSGVFIERTFEIGSQFNPTVAVRFGANYSGYGVSCNGSSDAIIEVQGAGGEDFGYQWITPAMDTISGSMIQNGSPGLYIALVTDANGCTIEKDVIVTEPPALEIMSEAIDIICAGQQTGEAELFPSGGAGGAFTYTWSHDPDYEFFRAVELAAGDYTVTATDANGCEIVDSFTIVEPDPLTAELRVVPFSVNTAGSAEAVVAGGVEPYTYVWFDSKGEAVSQNASLDRLRTADTYEVVIEDLNACSVTLSANIFNIDECLQSRAVLTPNDDGKNEFFEVVCIDIIAEKRLEVYNRFGNLVFEMTDYDGSWNGRDMDGNVLPSGAYFFILEYTDLENGETRQEKGTVTILTE